MPKIYSDSFLPDVLVCSTENPSTALVEGFRFKNLVKTLLHLKKFWPETVAASGQVDN